jgi:hypothetical protein
MKTVHVVKCYRRHGRLWIVYRYRNGRRFKQAYRAA